MRLFWMVIRYKDDLLQQHPHYAERNVFYLQDAGKRGDIPHVLFPSLALAEQHARVLSQTYPTEAIIILEQKCVFELPELPQPVKKRVTSTGEMIPDE